MKTNRRVNCRESFVVRRRSRNSVAFTNDQRLAPRASRRGILLLVVLSLLTLFLLIGTAFIVTANQNRLALKNYANATEASNSTIDQGNLLDEVINQLVRDTNNQNSSLRFHSLLRDMYGNDGLRGEIAVGSATWAGGGGAGGVTGGQMIQFTLSNITDQFGIPYSPTTKQLSQINNAYNGQVLTFLEGPARGQSVRLVGYLANTGTFRVMSPRLANGSTITTPGDLNTSRIAINGRPFNGTGVGYDSTNTAANSAKLSTTELVAGQSAELCLVPNSAFFDHLQFNTNGPGTFAAHFGKTAAQWGALTAQDQQRLIDGMGIVGLGGSDESYDVPDFQNMLLAMLPTNPVETMLLGQPGSWPAILPPSLGNTVLPSLQRPALLRFWQQQLSGGATELWNEPNLLRKVLLRPNWLDHPNFTGSNPDLDGLTPPQKLTRMIFGPWDVDNDNDGIRDSIWVDVGLPVMENADGRLVKPLAAIMVLDMDGRLNINAHGSGDIANIINFNALDGTLAGGNDTDNLPQGQGFGPAEISLAPVLGLGRFRGMLDGMDPNNIPAVDVADPANSDLRDLAARLRRLRRGKYGIGTDSAPGRSGNYIEAYDVAAQVKMQGTSFDSRGRIPTGPGPDTVWGNDDDFFVLGGYATPLDLRGRFALGLNSLGQPVYEGLFETPGVLNWTNADSPYEIDLSLGASRGESATADDGAYSMAEMERVLRAYDLDAGTLPSRIWELAGEFKPTAAATTPDLDDLNLWRTTVTADSYDLPVPSVVVPGWMRNGLNGTNDPTGPTSDDFEDVMGRPPVGLTFADLLEYRIRVGINPTNPSAPLSVANAQLLRREMQKLLPQDLADGLRLDINRPFGNGRDDNANGVVDEPGEDEGAFWVSNGPNSLPTAFTGTNGQFRDAIDRDGNGTITDFERGDTDASGAVDTLAERVAVHNLRRQMLARDLYVMALTLVDPLPSTATPENVKQRARKLAQWAINVVDFRDPDNIMTAFEYDVNPFDGWEVDGNLSTDEGAPAEREFVWGAERPELLITETLGWHDRQTTDTANEVADLGEERGTVTEGKDEDYDQKKPPRGYGFIELTNPWPENPAQNADTYGTDASGDFGVDLSRVTPVATGETDPDPVWRMVLYKQGGASKDIDDPDTDNHPFNRGFKHLADRTVYFTAAPFQINKTRSFGNDGVAFYSSVDVPTPTVPAGGYMIVTGAKSSDAISGQSLAIFGENIVSGEERGILVNKTNNRITVQSNGTQAVMDPDGFQMVGNNVEIAFIDKPRRFSFSEPAHGYPALIPGQTSYNPPRDIPFDDLRVYRATAIDSTGRVATGKNARLQDGETRLTLPSKTTGGRTIPGFSWIYLQRLANPLMPWNPPALLPNGSSDAKHRAGEAVNPYRTVDTMGANVTVFNGLDAREKRWPDGADRNNPAEMDKYSNFEAIESFSSVQRGRSNKPTSTGAQMQELQESARGAQRPASIKPPLVPANLWNYETIGSADGAPFGGFWKNQAGLASRGDDTNSVNYNFGGIPDCTLGFLNEPFRAAGSAEKIIPEQPFPWITWNNRPFANAGEIMQVPAFRSSQMLQAFSMRAAATDLEDYDGSVKELQLSSTLTLQTDGPYGHLLNFFRTKNRTTAGKEGIVGLHRMLDYLHVPSPFVKTETWMNPQDFGAAAVTSPDDPRYSRQPPFNRISAYREPGRVNMNTVINEAVYAGLMHKDGAEVISPSTTGQVHPGPTWKNLKISRRGYTGGNSLLHLDSSSSSVPTFFANPFRSASAADLVPLASMLRTGVNCTALREGSTANTPLFAATTSNAYNNADRNPYFRYQPMTRLSSMTTTRSNVYAVWVTIGFFEVEEADFTDPTINANVNNNRDLFDKVYPEGYMLGKEAGSDTGDIRRVREFAMIDRTVPVAFEPGENHNVEKAIRLRRRIE